MRRPGPKIGRGKIRPLIGADMSTTLTASSRGRGVSMLKRSGGSPRLDAAPELLFGGEQEVLIERIGMDLDLDPFAAAGDDRENGAARGGDPHVVLQLRHVLFGCSFLGEGPGQHELGFEHRAGLFDDAVQRCRHPFVDGMADALLDVLDGLP